MIGPQIAQITRMMRSASRTDDWTADCTDYTDEAERFGGRLLIREICVICGSSFCVIAGGGELSGELDRSDHGVRPGDAASGDFECGPMIRARAREGEPERHIHAAVEGVQLQRNQA